LPEALLEGIHRSVRVACRSAGTRRWPTGLRLLESLV